MNNTAPATALPSIFPSFFSPQNKLGDIVVMDLAIIMFVAAIMIAITYKLKQPMVIGYILAGMIIGPYTPPFTLVSSLETVNLLAELGVVTIITTFMTPFIMRFSSRINMSKEEGSQPAPAD